MNTTFYLYAVGGSESSTESENDDEVDSPEFYTPWKHRPDIQSKLFSKIFIDLYS